VINFLFFLPSPEHPQYSKKGLHLRWKLGWVKGWLVRPYWKLREWFGGSRIRVGKRFCLYGSLTARGPGWVKIGDDCIVGDGFTPYTHSREAVIQVGSRTFLNGSRLGCMTRIEIGEDCILADIRIFDSDYHSIYRNRNTAGRRLPATASILIGRNVWISAGCAILKGVQIGEDSVVGFGSVVTKSIPEGKIVAGNPAVIVGDVPS
jgi:acetyltransferase-like isoleucine patch superfamily enzyme